MSVKTVNLNFDDLRKIAIACHCHGVGLKSPGLTFSHGNVGNEYLLLAKKIDDLVQDSEPYHLFLLSHNGELPKGKDEVAYEMRVVQDNPGGPWRVAHHKDDNSYVATFRGPNAPSTTGVRSDAAGGTESVDKKSGGKRPARKKSKRR